MTAKDLTINDIACGDQASFKRIFSEADMQTFAELSGNMNPLHLDEDYAKTTKFKQRIVYGMLAGITCSTLVGMYLPGKRCLCLRQSLSFKKPIFIGDEVKIEGTVKAKSSATGILDIAISITSRGEEVIDGIMTVQVLE